MILLELCLTADRAGLLSSFLRNDLSLSSSLMNKLKWGDAIRVNGIPQHTNYSVTPGDIITVRLDEPEPDYPAEDGRITILYEDDHLLAVDKPAGMLIHPSRAQNTGTLANFVLGYYRKTGQNSAFHPLTRLDRDTFGVVLLAKNAHIHTLLQGCDVQKTYHAWVLGCPAESSGIIDAPIARKPLPSLLREVNPEGKPSKTCFTVLEKRAGLTKLALQPVTGRTHQLRLHCFHEGFPILGDPQYATAESLALSRDFGLSSQLLCAHELRLRHPITHRELVLTSTLDAHFPDFVPEL